MTNTVCKATTTQKITDGRRQLREVYATGASGRFGPARSSVSARFRGVPAPSFRIFRLLVFGKRKCRVLTAFGRPKPYEPSRVAVEKIHPEGQANQHTHHPGRILIDMKRSREMAWPQAAGRRRI